MSESDDPFMCLVSDENRDEVCIITFEEDVDECDDELIANKYWAVRDVDGKSPRVAATRGESALGMPPSALHAQVHLQ